MCALHSENKFTNKIDKRSLFDESEFNSMKESLSYTL